MAILLKQHNNVHSSAQTLIVPQIFHCMSVTENMIIGCFYKLRDKLKLFLVLINHLPQILLITFHFYLPRKIPLITLSLITENSCECSFCKQYFADSLAHLICKSNLVYRLHTAITSVLISQTNLVNDFQFQMLSKSLAFTQENSFNKIMVVLKKKKKKVFSDFELGISHQVASPSLSAFVYLAVLQSTGHCLLFSLCPLVSM